MSAFIADGFGLPVSHENEDYTPTGQTAYVALKVLHTPAAPFDFAHRDEVSGFLQFDLRYPAGSGAIPAKTKRSDIFAAYPVGRTVTYSGQAVTVTGKHAVSNRVDGGWYLVIGRINWRAYVPR
ncbi:MAG: phage tail terminator-like protein [Pikeienuella sp.]